MKIEDIENQIEVQKLIIQGKSSFDPYTSFSCLDTEGKGYLEPIDIYNFLDKFVLSEIQKSFVSSYKEARRYHSYQPDYNYTDNSKFKSQLCKALVNFFDVDNDGKLEYADYLSLVTPLESASRNDTKLDKINSTAYNSLQYETISDLIKLFELELLYQKEIENLKHEQENISNFSIIKSFKQLDESNDGFIKISTLQQAIKNEKV